MSPIEGALWDLDGVLVDTGELHWQAWSETLAQSGIPFTYEQFRATFGMNNTGILRMLLGDGFEPDLAREIGDRKESLFRRAIKGKVELLPGVLSWLERFKNWGVKQAIASSAPAANIDALVDELKIERYFAAVVSGSDLPGKPRPDVFLRSAERLGARPSACVVLEDALAGVEAARRAGMKCIAVTTTNPASALRTADVVVARLDELEEASVSQLFEEERT